MRRWVHLLFANLLVLSSVQSVFSESQAPPANIQALQQHFRKIIQRAEPSVVYIMVARGEPYAAPAAEQPGQLGVFPKDEQEKKIAKQLPHLALDHPKYQPETIGTGMIIHKKGLVLTPFHVVKNARHIYVRLKGQQGSYANIFAADEHCDLAILQMIKIPKKLQALQLGDAEELKKGDFIIALGYANRNNPQHMRSNAAWGIHSNHRYGTWLPGKKSQDSLSIYDYSYLLESDIRLNGAVSGSVWLNLLGEVVGIGTRKEVVQAGADVHPVAIPMSASVKRLLEVLSSGKEVEYGLIGTHTEDVSKKEMRALGIQVGGAVRITEKALTGTPAAKANLQAGDIILALRQIRDLGGNETKCNHRIRNQREFLLQIRTALAGSSIELEIIRNGKRIQRWVNNLGKIWLNQKTIVSVPSQTVRGLRVDYLTTLLGQDKKVAGGTSRIVLALQKGGVVVREVSKGSSADQAGLRPGDIITHVNGESTTDPRSFKQASKDTNSKIVLTMMDNRGQSKQVELK